ncbi:hypothetical protein GUITHDRAFT_84495 [Guillardia theta CCMP2712]|uniref:NAD(P)-binding domain-containing protein n=1 Tax=Guillardia theta (strain CCMP2712) TaxID=905079 RepID=L1JXG3_GUITC|nr:hypothetical protein GUITHDRAFT_84495 [Guillardia theta CCMP2712]EKX52895.1 hypothetical protein GUITHDRAFT_84495 [Guillardia theta CCMP2712]|eukprot:XP_005839875.1 hypothetical protein GUITHDRAFT_84495 [Guillardia theta CCMP2712]
MACQRAPLSLQMLLGVPKQVLVTGASGRTGFLTFTKLRELEKEFYVRGLVRSQKGAKKLETTGASLGDSEKIKEQNAKMRAMGLPADDDEPEVFVGDIMDRDSIQEAFDDLDALVILTSGVPKLRKREIVKTVLSKLIGRQRMPKFYYDQMPEEVDWLGCKCQIDLAKEKGIDHVVLVSSMGVSPQKNTPDNTLNKIGGGNILVWKAKAEDYLKESGLTYTIIHPGGLTNKPGGERELVLGTDDSLLDNYEQLGATRTIPREDVANLVIEVLRHKELVANKSFDVVTKDVGAGAPTKDWESLFKTLP